MSKQTFTHPKSAAALGAAAPSAVPVMVAGMPKLNTGSRYGDVIGAMILVMSVAHGSGAAWYSVPYHVLFFQWMYRELGVKSGPPLPSMVPVVAVDFARLNLTPNPDSVSLTDAEQTLGNTVRHLVNEGYLLAVRDGSDDHLVPTDKLIEAIVRD